MWCFRCRQDVPAIAAAFEQNLCCARCRQPLSRLPEPASTATGTVDPPGKQPGTDPELEELANSQAQQHAEIDEILSRAEWLLGLETAGRTDTKSLRQITGIHGAEDSLRGHHLSARHHPHTGAKMGRLTMLSWIALAVALTGFVCGGILLAWSLVGNRPELWNVGETVTLASQVGLLVGLILQLDRISHERQQTASRLTVLDGRVERLRSKSGIHPGLDSGIAGPHKAAHDPAEVMLADLQHQLDHLASRLGEKRSA